MQHDRLISMANQIAIFCASNPKGARHTRNFADHINNYWEPRMRLKLLEKIEGGETDGVHPLVIEALSAIRRPGAPKVEGHALDE